MEAAPRYKLPTLSALLKLLTLFTIQTAFHCLNSSMYAYMYSLGVRALLGFMSFQAICCIRLECMDGYPSNY